MKSPFPKDFLWGGSTASHQVEGDTHNQWSVWELENAKRLAKDAERRFGWLPIWEEIKAEAQDPNNYVSGIGIDHYNRYAADFDLITDLNMNAFRFGIEWSRIEPEPGVWDEAEIRHYHDYIDALAKRGIAPILNIWHWTMPVWFTDKGGFLKRGNLADFDRFVAKVAEEYGSKVRYIITLNEPNVYASFGYLTGEWVPQIKSWPDFLRVYYNLSSAHRRAHKIIKRFDPKLQVGLAAQLANIQAKRPHHVVDWVATKWMRYFWNWWFLNRTRNYQDFIAFNYYFTDYFKGVKRSNPHLPVNDLGWYMEPEGLYPLLLRIWVRFRRPIIVAENGVADRHDQYRQWWIEESVIAMERALSEGVELIGYMHWSLLDNFEWSSGWWPKFGLIAVDRKTLKRTVRPSAAWLADKLVELRGLDDSRRTLHAVEPDPRLKKPSSRLH